MKSFGSMQSVASRKTKNVFLVGFAFAAAVSASSGAFAQEGPGGGGGGGGLNALPTNCTGTATGNVSNIGTLGGSAGAVSSTIAGVIGNINTAFLTQQGSAFVSAPANPAPDQPGGGVWSRAIGGEVTVKSTTTNTGVFTSAGAFGGTLNDKCSNSLHQNFAGIQVGADIARLNWNGWNFHLGSTAGFLGSSASDNNGLRTGIEVPFFGTYLVATYGRFFADVLVRQDFYNLSVDNPNFNLLSQPIGAHGLSVSTSLGYNFALANNWFIEPSAGFVWSNTKVDSFNSAVPNGLGQTIGGTTSFSDVKSEVGRLSVRVGTTISTSKVIYQPFAAASVFHEFAGDVQSSFAFCPTCVFVAGVPAAFTQPSATSRVGTYGQYSLGLAAQIVNTGWLGFVRADYRNGDKIDGYTGNVGLRYQFTPDAIASAMPSKAPAMNPVFGTSNWSGVYIGGFFGGAYGRTDVAFVNAPTPTSSSPYVFGPLGGFELGYNYQVNNWVFGLEGDFGGASLRGGRTCGNDDGTGNVTGFNSFYQTCNDRMNWMGTLAARLGYASGRTLYYVKAGGAVADGRVKIDCVDGIYNYCNNPAGFIYPGVNSNGTDTTQTSRNRYGWTLGFGTEFDLGKNWSAKTEYDYIDFGKYTQLASDGATLLSNRSSISQVKIGVNYRFGAGPVVARY